MNNNHFSLKISIFHGIKAAEEGLLVGYGAVIEALGLKPNWQSEPLWQNTN